MPNTTYITVEDSGSHYTLAHNNCRLTANERYIPFYSDPLNPLNLPPFTMRLQYVEGVTPSFSKGTGVQVSSSPNIWDWTYANTDWGGGFGSGYDNTLIAVLGANSTGVVSMRSMFIGFESLATVALFDTSSCTRMHGMFSNTSVTSLPAFNTTNVTQLGGVCQSCIHLTTVPDWDVSAVENISQAFQNCTSLTEIPDWNIDSVTNMVAAFSGCLNVQTGALALYQKALSKSIPVTLYLNCFYQCGSNTTTGQEELAQIPTNWGGTMS